MLDVLSFLGAALAVSTLTMYTSRSMQLQGFIMIMVLLLAVVAVLVLNPNLKVIAVTIYAFVYFFCGFGPASTTFLMPSLLAPVETRGTINGVAAAAGRIGMGYVCVYMCTCDVILLFFCGCFIALQERRLALFVSRLWQMPRLSLLRCSCVRLSPA